MPSTVALISLLRSFPLCGGASFTISVNVVDDTVDNENKTETK